MTDDARPVETFAFETLTLNAAGEVAQRRPLMARRCVEPLAPGLGLALVFVPGGAFMMGSPRGQGADDERPQHRVNVAPFWMGQGPVTQAQWEAVMGRPARCRFQGAGLPVDSVSWRQARRFCERLSSRTGRPYWLPSEARWEYACRAGTTGPFSCGETLTSAVANYNGEFVFRSEPRGVYRHVTTPASTFPPNAFGLWDLHGNIWEWCADAWHANYAGAPPGDQAWEAGGEKGQRVARGGCWHDTPDVCRSAARLRYAEDEGDELVGFRVVCDLGGDEV